MKMTYKRILIPNKENHKIDIPSRFFGKRVEIIVKELDSFTAGVHPTPPIGKRISLEELFEDFGANPGFPSIDEIISKAWPSKW
jgi:hypothetical protein